MNRLFSLTLLLFILAACSAPDTFRCTGDGELCILLQPIEPIQYGEPILVTITVTSQRDIYDLGVSISYDADIYIDGPEYWEDNIMHPTVFTGGASWGVSVNEGETVIFTRKLYVRERNGEIWLKAVASTMNFRITDGIRIYMTPQGGTVYLSGTSIPITPGPLPTTDPILLETLQAMPSSTPWPTLTPRPTATVEVTTTPYPPPELPPPDAPYP